MTDPNAEARQKLQLLRTFEEQLSDWQGAFVSARVAKSRRARGESTDPSSISTERELRQKLLAALPLVRPLLEEAGVYRPLVLEKPNGDEDLQDPFENVLTEEFEMQQHVELLIEEAEAFFRNKLPSEERPNTRIRVREVKEQTEKLLEEMKASEPEMRARRARELALLDEVEKNRPRLQQTEQRLAELEQNAVVVKHRKFLIGIVSVALPLVATLSWWLLTMAVNSMVDARMDRFITQPELEREVKRSLKESCEQGYCGPKQQDSQEAKQLQEHRANPTPLPSAPLSAPLGSSRSAP